MSYDSNPSNEPFNWPAASWVRVYFGDAAVPSELTSRFHRLLAADKQLDLAEFDAYLVARRNAPGDLLVFLDGRIAYTVPPTVTFAGSTVPRSFRVTPETARGLARLCSDAMLQSAAPRSFAHAPQDELGSTIFPTPLPVASDVSQAVATRLPEQIGQYRILKLLGRGGMGVVYLAVHEALQRQVAIKVLPGARFNDPEAVARLLREARIGAKLSHPGICQTLDAGQIDGDFYYVMEFLDGEGLDRLLKRRGRLSIGLACDLAYQLIEVLQFLGERQVVHRDIKPNNLMICEGNRLKVLDLGLAKEITTQAEVVSYATAPGQIMGTPVYMAPEQVEDAGRVSPQADLYAAGATLYEMLTGRRPFEGPVMKVYAAKLAEGPPPDPRDLVSELPDELTLLVRALMARDPAERPQYTQALQLLEQNRVPDEDSLPDPGVRTAHGDDEAIGLPPRSSPALPPSDSNRSPVPAQTEIDGPLSLPPPFPVHPIARSSGLLPRLAALATNCFGAVCAGVAAVVRGVVRMLQRPREEEQRTMPGPDVPVEKSWVPEPSAVSDPSVRTPVTAVRRAPVGVGPAPLAAGGVTGILRNIDVAHRLFKDPRADDLLDLLPRQDGKPCVGHYFLEERLGPKAPVSTYRARQTKTGAEFIVRLLPLTLGTLRPELLKQLGKQSGQLVDISRRCRGLARLWTLEETRLVRGSHPSVYYTVEDVVAGESLEYRIDKQHRPLPPRTALRCLVQAVRGLLALHEGGLLHGNLHPGKLLFNEEHRQLWVCDLSYACKPAAETVGATRGRPANEKQDDVDLLGNHSPKRRRYLAPEVFVEKKPPGVRAEQYALGVVFIEAISGKFLRSDANDLALYHYVQVDLNKYLRGIEADARELASILRRMVGLDPDDRYPNLGAVLDDLRALLPARVKKRKVADGPGRADTPAPGQPPLPLKTSADETDSTDRGDSTERPEQGTLRTEEDPDDLTRTVKAPYLAPGVTDDLVSLLAQKAAVAPGGPYGFFQTLIRRAKLPDSWRVSLANLGQGNPNVDALGLVMWALDRKRNTNDPRYQTLGSLLDALLPELGFEDACFVAAVISRCGLYTDRELRLSFELAFQVPHSPAPDEQTARFGAFRVRRELPPEKELQGWFKRPPDLLDVGFLRGAIEQAAAVCRVEVGGERRGTGFLVASDLVLTNYHVLGDDLAAVAPRVELRFGCYTERAGNEAKGRSFGLAAVPLVKSSGTDDLDYVLLRVADDIKKARDLRPVSPAVRAPKDRDSLNILQHPEGDAMKVSVCSNGVTYVDRGLGVVQYLTQTRGGSSGSPCFNDNWEVVALHHAQYATAFGSCREGILFGPIYDEIRKYL